MGVYVHGHHDAVLRSHRSRTAENSAAYLLPHLTGSERLLDVGSGPGTITADLATLVGSVVALEMTPDAVALTRAEIVRRDVTNVECRVGDVHTLPFPDAAFDVVHAHQVLQHVSNPVLALQEMARVTRPGGLIAARDSDYGAFFWSPDSPILDEWRTLYQHLARVAGGEPDAGRHYPDWVTEAGLTDVTLTSSSWCYTSAEEREWWAALWAERVTASTFATVANERGIGQADLDRIAEGWRAWGAAPNGVFVVPSVELLARV